MGLDIFKVPNRIAIGPMHGTGVDVCAVERPWHATFFFRFIMLT
jgi:hypothetical protein